MATVAEVVTDLKNRFADVADSEFRGQMRVIISQPQCFEAISHLKHDHGFDMLVDLTCVDYLNFRDATDRFGLVYVLANTDENLQLILRVMLNEPDLTIPSVVPLWEAANWMEREVWDMFGIHFEGHPDLRRILLPEEFDAFPLRKDYPLQGRGERHNFPVLTRGEA